MHAADRLPDKSSAADPIPVSVLEQTVDVLAPFVTDLFNCSFSTGHFPAVLKMVFIAPVIKQDAQLSQIDRAAGCVIVFARSRTLELGDNDLRTL